MRLLKEIRNLLGSYHVKSGIYHYYRNEFKPAVEFFRRALGEDETLSESDRRIARYYLTETFMNSAERLAEKGDLEGAVADYRRAAEVGPDYADIRFRLGGALRRLGRVGDAIEEYRRAVGCNADYLEARVALAFCLLESGRAEEAGRAFSQALELKIRLVKAPCEQGLRALREGRIEEAAESFHEALVKFPPHFERAYRAALEHLKAEEYDVALEKTDEALALDPRCPDLHNFRGVALCELGRVDEAIEAFRRSMGLKADYQVAQLNLAFAHLRLGQLREAESQLEAILEQDPTQSAAATRLAELTTGRAAETRRNAPRAGSR